MRSGVLVCALLVSIWLTDLGPATYVLSAAEAPESAVTVTDGVFVERVTGEPFVPRGFNYIRLFPRRSHNTFDPEHYDAEALEKALGRWNRDGFSAVRVFLNCHAPIAGTIARPGEEGLSKSYVANVADFLDRARKHRIAVMLCTESFPRVSPYGDTLVRADAALDEANASYLAAGHVEAKARFLQDLIRGLQASRPECLGAIFSYDLQNEFCYHGGPPFTLVSGTVQAANGRRYDLPDQRQELADEGAIYFIDRMADAIHEAHPGALVSARRVHLRGRGS